MRCGFGSGRTVAVRTILGSPSRTAALVALAGPLRLACLMLLDGLVKGGAVIYYSGDFDPEGLQMAQKLIQRYPGRVSEAVAL